MPLSTRTLELAVGGAVLAAAAAALLAGPATAFASFRAPPAGLDEEDLWALYGAPATPARARFVTAALALHADPRVAMAGARALGGGAFEAAFWGADEAAAKSPWSWALLALAPGALAARYAAAFLDTNPLLAAAAIANLLLRDALFWADAAAAARGLSRAAAARAAARAAGRALATAAAALLYLHVVARAAPALAALAGGAARVAWALAAPLRAVAGALAADLLPAAARAAAARATHLAFWDAAALPLALGALALANARALARTLAGARGGALDAARLRDVAAALDSAAPLFTDAPWEALYERGALLGGGGFGTVHAGAARATGTPVAIKTFRAQAALDERARARADPLERAVELALAAARFNVDAMTDELQARLSALARAGEGALSTARVLCEHEVRALRALKGLRHPAFIDLLTAHAGEGAAGECVVVTALAGRTLDRAKADLTPAARRRVLRQAAEAVALMHSAGFVHRDLKADNIATRLGDAEGPPVLIDVGIARLPGAGAGALSIVDQSGAKECCPPEWVGHAARPPPLPASALALHQAHDVWAMALCVGSVLFDGAIVRPKSPELARVAAGEWTEADAAARVAAVGARGPMAALLEAMLHPDPAARPTMAAVVAHAAWAAAGAADAAAAPPPPRAPEAPAPAAHPFDAGDARGHALRQAARRERLHLLCAVVAAVAAATPPPAAPGSARRGAASPALCGGARAPLPGDVVARLQRAFTAVVGPARGAAVARGAQFDRVLAAAGLGGGALAFDHGELFTLLDADESGALDRRELLAGLALLLAPRLAPRERLALLFAAFDADGSGGLDRAELGDLLESVGVPARGRAPRAAVEADERAVAALFAKLDADHDGAVSLGELVAGVEADDALRARVLGDGPGAGAPEAPRAPSPAVRRR